MYGRKLGGEHFFTGENFKESTFLRGKREEDQRKNTFREENTFGRTLFGRRILFGGRTLSGEHF